MKYYPMFVDIRNKKCVVLGGGDVATRKVLGLLDAGAKVTVVSHSLSQKLTSLARAKKIRVVKGSNFASPLTGAVLAIAATSSATLNQRLAQACKRQGMWVNVVDKPKQCTFIAPAVVKQGELIIAISTGGAAPALARSVRERLEQEFGKEYHRLVKFLGQERTKLTRLIQDTERRKQFLNEVNKKLIRVARSEPAQSLKRHYDQLLDKYIKKPPPPSAHE